MIRIKKDNEIALLRKGGKILAEILHEIGRGAKPGVETGKLEMAALELIYKSNAQPSFKNYRDSKKSPPFPTALCASINAEVVHAPSLPSRKLRDGDILSIDLGIKYPRDHGYYTDMAITVGIGEISGLAKKLMSVTKESLAKAIEAVREDSTINDISLAVQRLVELNGFSVVRSLVGHGVGHQVHEDPKIPNFETEAGKKILLKEGMVLAIEPMVCEGGHDLEIMNDGWTAITADKRLSAHFEHTILVKRGGVEVLTKI